MLTTPITTPHFHSRVLALLSSHLSQLRPVSVTSEKSVGALKNSPPPIIPPLRPVDTPLSPSPTLAQLLAIASPWTDLCSPDPLIANLSRQVLNQEVAYAAFCGVGNIIVPGPKLHHRDVHGSGITQYARAIQEALNVASYLSIQILMPMTDHPDSDAGDGVGSLAPFAREDYVEESGRQEGRRPDTFGTWDAWNVIRTVCKYSPRLFVGKRDRTRLSCISGFAVNMDLHLLDWSFDADATFLPICTACFLPICTACFLPICTACFLPFALHACLATVLT